MRYWKSLLWVALVAVLSCGAEPEAVPSRYDLSGKVVAIEAEADRVTLDHEAIPGFMEGMTMSFELKDSWVFNDLEEGDRIEATLVVTADDFWLEGAVVSRESDNPGTVSGLPDPELFVEVPDFELVNQDGRTIHLTDFRGQALLLTFIYAQCPLSDFCPRMTNHFAEIEKQLQKDPALYEKTHLLSVSFDTANDSPEVLKRYAHEQAGLSEEALSHWDFASGAAREVRALATFFALDYWTDGEQIMHSLRTVIIDPQGKLHRLYRGNSWTPEHILADLEALDLR